LFALRHRVITQPSDATENFEQLATSPILAGAKPTYTATNVTTDRAYDADATTVAELADVLGTLIADLRARGIVA
jgi:hypothetical protein